MIEPVVFGEYSFAKFQWILFEAPLEENSAVIK